MILLADSEGPDQTAGMHMPETTLCMARHHITDTGYHLFIFNFWYIFANVHRVVGLQLTDYGHMETVS